MKLSRFLALFLFALFLSGAYTTGGRGASSPGESTGYIEVCTNGLAYLPHGTRYVTCHGRLMRVVYIAPHMEITENVEDCDCPKCCGGLCGITVMCESAPEPSSGQADCGGCPTSASAGGGLCTAYLACD